VKIYEQEVNGKEHGKYIIYNTDGSIELEARYHYGKRIFEKRYDTLNQISSIIECAFNEDSCSYKYFDNGQIKNEGTASYSEFDFEFKDVK